MVNGGWTSAKDGVKNNCRQSFNMYNFNMIAVNNL
jgi:hypothetical protein